MNKVFLLGIDIGTSSVKSLLMREDGTAVGIARRAYGIVRKAPNYAEQNMDMIWNAVSNTVSELVKLFPEEASNIKGIGFSGQMHGLVAITQEGKPVRDALIWADERTGETIQEIYTRIPEKKFSAFTLNKLSTGFLVASLYWMREFEPQNYKRIWKVMFPKDYIRFRMTGELQTDYSDASGSGVFNVKERDWAWELLDKLELDKNFFLPCASSITIAGKVTKECSDLTGLKENIPVFLGGGDTIIQAIGNGVNTPGILISNIGTASQLVCIVEQPIHDLKYRTNTFCHAENKKWLLMGANLSGGITLEWLKNCILKQENFDAFNNIEIHISRERRGLFFLPYLQGERTPWNDSNAKGVYIGLNLNHTQEDIIRATMEGIVFNQKNSLEIFKEMGISYNKVIASGGGTKGRVMQKIIANMFNCCVIRTIVQEQGCVGAAICAAVGSGIYRNCCEASESIVKYEPEIIEPEPDMVSYYEDQFSIFKKIYPVNRELFQLIRYN